jgi:uncharacterized protein YjiS (DUF1127 family)
MSDYRINPPVAKGGARKMEAAMWKRVKNWWVTWGAMVQLQGLDQRLMADMGLQREGLRARVAGRTPQADSADPPLAPERAHPASDSHYASLRCAVKARQTTL